MIFDFDANQVVISHLMEKKSLFSLVSVETLLCSLFFLMVIAARLRFSNIIDRVNRALNIAKAYNQKEELLYEKIQKEKWAERWDRSTGRSENRWKKRTWP